MGYPTDEEFEQCRREGGLISLIDRADRIKKQKLREREIRNRKRRRKEAR